MEAPIDDGNAKAATQSSTRRVAINRRRFLSTVAGSAAIAAPLSAAFAHSDKFARDRNWSSNEPVSFPDPAWEVHDKRFTGRQLETPLLRIWHGSGNDAALWSEGPVWMGDWGCLLWSDIPNHRVLRWCEDDGRVSVFQTESGYANGHTRDNQGRLISMEQDTRQVRRRGLDAAAGRRLRC